MVDFVKEDPLYPYNSHTVLTKMQQFFAPFLMNIQ